MLHCSAGGASDTSVVIFGCSAATTEAFTEAALDPDGREAEVEPSRDAEDVEDVREVIKEV